MNGFGSVRGRILRWAAVACSLIDDDEHAYVAIGHNVRRARKANRRKCGWVRPSQTQAARTSIEAERTRGSGWIGKSIDWLIDGWWIRECARRPMQALPRLARSCEMDGFRASMQTIRKVESRFDSIVLRFSFLLITTGSPSVRLSLHPRTHASALPLSLQYPNHGHQNFKHPPSPCCPFSFPPSPSLTAAAAAAAARRPRQSPAA